MSRAYKELDGTLDNVGGRIVEDYDNYCDYRVGELITDALSDKLDQTHMQTLGFTPDKLTVPIGSINIADTSGLHKVMSDLYHVGIYAVRSGITNYAIDLVTLKASKKKLIVTTSEDRWAQRNNNQTFVFMDTMHGFTEAFETNTACAATFGVKPSKFLSKYIERIIPGITERYALVNSQRHTMKVMLSIDPNIMINCSESATFSSCFIHDGEYHYSTHRYATSMDSMMAVIFDESGYIRYRNWVLVSSNLADVITLQGYTSISGHEIHKATKKITRDFIMGEDKYEESAFSVAIGDTDGSYIDDYEYYRNPEKSDWYANCIPVNLGDAYDLNDGAVTYDVTPNGLCCCHCEDRCNQDDISYIENVGDVCGDCISRYSTWSDVHDRYIDDNRVCVTIHGDVYDSDAIGDEHVLVNDEWAPHDEVTMAYDTDEYHLDTDVTYCEELDRYYYDTETMKTDMEYELEAN